MREWILEHAPAIIAAMLAGLAGGLGMLAYFRRLELERYIKAHEDSDACQCRAYSRRNLGSPKRDFLDREIARSVERMTKETR